MCNLHSGRVFYSVPQLKSQITLAEVSMMTVFFVCICLFHYSNPEQIATDTAAEGLARRMIARYT